MAGCQGGREPPGRCRVAGGWPLAVIFNYRGPGQSWQQRHLYSQRMGGGRRGQRDETLPPALWFDVETEHWPVWLSPCVMERLCLAVTAMGCTYVCVYLSSIKNIYIHIKLRRSNVESRWDLHSALRCLGNKIKFLLKYGLKLWTKQPSHAQANWSVHTC